MGSLTNKKIVIAGSRKTAEMSVMIEKKGGIPLSRPLQETVKKTPEEMKSTIEHIIENGTDWSLFTTGIGTEAVFQAAETLGLATPLHQSLAASNIAARGYKTIQALKKAGLPPVVEDGDGTNAGLLEALAKADLSGQRVLLQLHGERVPLLENGLAQKGAAVTTILPYETIVPDRAIVAQLVEEVITGEVDAVLFTATPQVRVLFKEAAAAGKKDALAAAFQERVVAGSVGKVTSGSLSEYGVTRIIAPELERMGALIVAVDSYFKET